MLGHCPNLCSVFLPKPKKTCAALMDVETSVSEEVDVPLYRGGKIQSAKRIVTSPASYIVYGAIVMVRQ